MAFRITGGTGLLGRYLTALLEDKAVDYTVLSRRQTIEDAHQIQTDYSQAALEMIFQEGDVIVHLAGNRGPRKDISSYTEELKMAQHVFEAALECDCKQVIVASSISVYADTQTLPWTEADAVDTVPKSLYGLNKLYIEQLAAYYRKHYQLDVVCLRFSHLYGALEQNNYMINYFMRLALLGKPLTVMGESDVSREFLYAKDAATAIWQAAQHPDVSLIQNIKGSETLTNLEVAQHINQAFDNSAGIERQDEDVPDYFEPSYMDGTRAQEEIDFVPRYRFIDALQEIYQEMEGLRDELPEKY
ncbi:NAD-dependent epimerase/dehydratase family protein [Staphylococcus simulans]|uniref:NAD-dependent epimerase/dehydratase family protein n=1 Tax=Staphylococcus simulans TaxID=1286 RepID=UPI00399BB80D